MAVARTHEYKGCSEVLRSFGSDFMAETVRQCVSHLQTFPLSA